MTSDFRHLRIHFLCVFFCNIFKSEDILYYRKTRDRHLNLIVSYCILFLAPTHMSSDSYLKTFSEIRLCVMSNSISTNWNSVVSSIG